ncbi:MAG: hypothetical protein AB8H80_12885 [Planctomycetota bacterium]
MKSLQLSTFTLLTAYLLSAPAFAQSTTAATTINQDGFGCQDGTGRLTGGVVIGSIASVTYDPTTAVLQFVVANTTPVVAGEANPTIQDIWFNVPDGAVTGMTLTNQVGSGGAAPQFTLQFDPTTSLNPNPLSAGCFGEFNVQLSAPAGSFGIANPAAPQVATPNAVTGPVTFTFQLTGPGTAFIDAEAFLAASSQKGALSTNYALNYQRGGSNAQEFGIVGSCELCRTSVYLVGNPSVGSTFDICVTGGFGCHACLWVSGTPGPVVVSGIELPVGLPIAAAWDLGDFGLGNASNTLCLTVPVPNNAQLAGFQFYLANVTYNALNVQGYDFSLPRTVTIQ